MLRHVSGLISHKIRDPRIFQIAVLSSLLIFGLSAKVFDIPLTHILATLTGALGAQVLGSLLFAIRVEIRSALITTLSLLLLLRADGPLIMAGAAAISVGSKFALRWGDKHIFNPANAGIVFMLMLTAFLETNSAWTTPGQWGTALWFAALLAGLGVFVTTKATRLEVPIFFLATFAVLAFGRSIWLGDPLSIPINRLQNGALILFAFFMISDPKTTPNGLKARAVFAVGVALLAHLFTYQLHSADGPFFALFIVCAIRPILETLDRAPQYAWPVTDGDEKTVEPSSVAPPAWVSSLKGQK